MRHPSWISFPILLRLLLSWSLVAVPSGGCCQVHFPQKLDFVCLRNRVCAVELGGNAPFIVFDDADGEEWRTQYAHTHAFTSIHTRARGYASAHMHKHARMRIHMHTHICTCVHAHIHAHISVRPLCDLKSTCPLGCRVWPWCDQLSCCLHLVISIICSVRIFEVFVSQFRSAYSLCIAFFLCSSMLLLS